MINADEAEPEALRRPLPRGEAASSTTGGWTPAGISNKTRLAEHRHLGGRHEALPRRAAGDQRPRPRQGREDHRLVRAGARHARHLALRQASRVAARQGRRAEAAEPRQPRGPQVAHRPRRQAASPSRASTSTARTSTSTRWPTGGRTTPRTARASPRSGTSTGYLAYWDELRRRHPDMLIDSCASRRPAQRPRDAAPRGAALRSDYILEPVGNQCHTYGISFWIPLLRHRARTSSTPTASAACMCPYINACFDMRDARTSTTTRSAG